MRFQFTRSSRKHRIGRASARIAMAAGEPVAQIDGCFLWVGIDERGRELEIVGVPIWEEDLVLVIHVMPTALRRRK